MDGRTVGHHNMSRLKDGRIKKGIKHILLECIQECAKVLLKMFSVTCIPVSHTIYQIYIQYMYIVGKYKIYLYEL